MYCSQCGRKLKDNTNFCPSCGTAIKKMQKVNELADLVEKVRSGDQNAVAALYEKTYSQVFYTVKSMIKDEDAVFDILQDSYIKAFTHLDKFEGNEKFLPWIKQIAANTARDWLKKKKPMLFVELEPDGEQNTPIEEQFIDERSTSIPEQVIDQQETTRLIREIIEELPEDQRAVIGMFYYEELSVKQIAAAMEISESAVKSRLMYGRKKIEVKVRELEKKGTKLYSLAPIPFLLLLFRSQKVYAAEIPDEMVLDAVLKSTKKMSGNAAKFHTAENAASNIGAATSTAAATGSMGITKIILIVLASAAVFGAGGLGVSHLLKENPEPVSSEIKTSDETQKEQDEEIPEENDEAETDVVETALERYRSIISQADSLPFGDYRKEDLIGEYKYALVQMQPEDTVPTLLLAQKTWNSLYAVRVFQYNPENDTMYQPSEVLSEGVASSSSFRGNLDIMGDGNGLSVTELAGGNGDMTICRVTLDGDSLKVVVEWEGFFSDGLPADHSVKEIEWHEIGDTAILEAWTADAKPSPETPDSGNAVSEGTELPKDGDRIVFRGTIDIYSFDEIVKLQGIADMKMEQWTDTTKTYLLVVPDTPQVMELGSGDGQGTRSDEVQLICIRDNEELKQYAGQHLIFSMNPNKTWWPSDLSLPYDQPTTKDIRILE